MKEYYVTRYKRKFKGDWRKTRYSLRSFHFANLEQAEKFFNSLDSAIYCANLKSFDNGKTEIIKTLKGGD